jgi:hypothetical protein
MQKLIADIEEYIGAGKLPPKRKSNQNQGGDVEDNHNIKIKLIFFHIFLESFHNILEEKN